MTQAKEDTSLLLQEGSLKSTKKELLNEIRKLRIQNEEYYAVMSHQKLHLEKIYKGRLWRMCSVYFHVRDRIKSFVIDFSLKVVREADSLFHSKVVVPVGDANKISVILPVYNQANFLDASIKSVLNQTYKNIELIIVNDGSTDGVEKVLQKYYLHPKIKIFTQPNQKLPIALNNGFYMASGQFYTWTSADNIMLPTQLEELLNHMRARDAHFVYSDYQAIDDKGKPLNDPAFRPHNQDKNNPSIMRLPDTVTISNFHDSGDNFIGASFLYSAISSFWVGSYNPRFLGGEDYDYWLRVHLNFGAVHLDKVLYKYRVHDNTLNARAKKLKLFENVAALLKLDRRRIHFWDKTKKQQAMMGKHRPHSDILFFSSENLDAQVLRKLKSAGKFLVLGLKHVPIDMKLLYEFDVILTDSNTIFESLKYLFFNRIILTRGFRRGLKNPQLKSLIVNRYFENRFSKNTYLDFTASKFVPHTKRVNVAIVTDSLDTGGLEEVVYRLAKGLDSRKIKVYVVVNGKKLGRIAREVTRQGIEVLSTNGTLSGLMKVLVTKKIHVINSHYSDMAVDGGRELNIPTIYTMHNSYIWKNSDEILRKIKTLACADVITCVSDEVKRFAIHRLGAKPSKIQVVPNGLDLTQFGQKKRKKSKLVQKIGLDSSDFVFLNVARISGIKNQLNLIHAFSLLRKEYKNAQLVIAGSVDDAQYLQKIKNQASYKEAQHSIHFVDHVDKSELIDLYENSHCFILPSVCEGWSMAVMEALYCNLPIVLTQTGSAETLFRKFPNMGVLLKPIVSDLWKSNLSDVIHASEFSPELSMQIYKAMKNVMKHSKRYKKEIRKNRSRLIKCMSHDTFIDTYKSIIVKSVV